LDVCREPFDQTYYAACAIDSICNESELIDDDYWLARHAATTMVARQISVVLPSTAARSSSAPT